MRLPILFVLVIFLLISCTHDSNTKSLQYIMAKRNSGFIDTVYMDIIDRQTTDSSNIIKYKVKRDIYSPYEGDYNLPNKIDTTSNAMVRFVCEKTIPFEDKQYRILKYQFDDPKSDDEESLYFYSPEFGIILFHFGTHRNSLRLIHTGDEQKDKIIYFLTDQMENDFNMTKEWK